MEYFYRHGQASSFNKRKSKSALNLHSPELEKIERPLKANKDYGFTVKMVLYGRKQVVSDSDTSEKVIRLRKHNNFHKK
ncbi:hypothetical protein ANTPLA_LOCUS8147 [Anthophora plagiata]